MHRGLFDKTPLRQFNPLKHGCVISTSCNSPWLPTKSFTALRQSNLQWLIALLTLMFVVPALAAAPQSTELSFGDDRFATGERLSISHPVAGDLVSAAGNIDITAEVAGDLLAFGGQIQLAGAARQDVYIAGGQVTILDSIAGNARIAGGDVSLASSATIAGNASICCRGCCMAVGAKATFSRISTGAVL